MDLLTNPEAWLALAVLSLMEMVFGIDNIVFISILTGRLPPERRLGARRLGIRAALISRILEHLGGEELHDAHALGGSLSIRCSPSPSWS